MDERNLTWTINLHKHKIVTLTMVLKISHYSLQCINFKVSLNVLMFDQFFQEVGPESGNNQSSRARMLKELCEVVAAKQLEEVGWK